MFEKVADFIAPWLRAFGFETKVEEPMPVMAGGEQEVVYARQTYQVPREEYLPRAVGADNVVSFPGSSSSPSAQHSSQASHAPVGGQSQADQPTATSSTTHPGIVLCSVVDYAGATAVADLLRDGRAVVVQLHGLFSKNEREAQMTLQFLYGVGYSLNVLMETLEPAESRIYLLSPRNIPVVSDMKAKMLARDRALAGMSQDD